MKRLILLSLLLCSCVTAKPFFFAAERQEKELIVPMMVFYGDYEEAEVKDTVQAAVVDFALRTRIVADVIEYRHMDWQSREMYAMMQQCAELYPNLEIPARWVLMIYKKTPLEWVLMLFIGNVHGAAEAVEGGGHWAFVNRLSSDLIVHELYHLGWRIK